MPLNWMDVSDVSFFALLLMERPQIAWFPGWGLPQPDVQIALAANPAVAWYLRHKCPEIAGWVDAQIALAPVGSKPAEIRASEVGVLRSLEDLLVYALDPAVYDAQPFLKWDSRELTRLVDFTGKRVIDVGAGTGRLAFVAAPLARAVYAVEPVANLRSYMRQKALHQGFDHFYAVDGLITAIPFENGFADVTMGGHVFGDDPLAEHAELVRVTCPGGMIILCPGNNDVDNQIHAFLVDQGFAWSVFNEPRDGMKRKYWKTVEG